MSRALKVASLKAVTLVLLAGSDPAGARPRPGASGSLVGERGVVARPVEGRGALLPVLSPGLLGGRFSKSLVHLA